MIDIKISTAGGGKPFMRQLPSSNPVWGNCRFFINEDVPECDLWVVYGGIDMTETTRCPPHATLLITNEPPSIKTYAKKFTDQFGAILTCQRSISHPNIIFRQQALPWWVGHKLEEGVGYDKTYDELKSIDISEKEKLLSIIVSNKTFTKGHKKRLLFAQKLQEEFGDRIDIFGMGHRTIDDKWDAIAPYKYHIVIENSAYDHYWTEKLADAFLGQSYPIYYGCPNIGDYFPENALTAINIDNPEEAIETIKNIIRANTYEQSKESLRTAKQSILDKYQLFPMLAEYAHPHSYTGEKTITTLIPEQTSLIRRIIGKIRRLTHS